MIEAFCASVSDEDLPTIGEYKVSAAELKAISELTSPYFVGMGPIPDEDRSRRRLNVERKRRIRLITPSVRREAHRLLEANTVDGKPIAGFLFTTFFITYILPALVSWVIDKLIDWTIKSNWEETTATIHPLSCSIFNESDDE